MKNLGGDTHHPHPKLETFVLNLCICLLYVISGKIGLGFASVNPSATAIWPPTGIALASILLFGYRVIPAIFVGAFLVNITTAGTIGTSLGIALGNTLEGIVGTYLVKKFANGDHAFSTVSNIFKFFFFAAVLSTTVSASIGVITLLLGNLANSNNLLSIWTTWWLGDMGGDLSVAPFLIVWLSSPRIPIYFKETVNILLSFFILGVTTWFVFSGILPNSYLCIPIAVWIAFWFGRKGASIAILIVAYISIFYTLHGFGPFFDFRSINQSLISLQLFLGILSLTALTFAALVHTIRKGEKTLALHEARFKALIEKSFDAIVLVDATSKILYASTSVKRVIGYTPEELVGTVGFSIIAPEDRTFTIKTLASLVTQPGNTITVEYKVIKKSKKVIWVEATGTNLLFDPTVNAVVINFRDITEKKILQEKILQEKLEDEAMLASIGDGIIATNSEGKITMVNQAASDALGWTQKELIGKLLTTAIPMKDETGKLTSVTERPITKVLSLRKKMITSQTYYYVRKNKTTFPVRFTVTPMTMNRQIVGIIEVFHDITKEKEIDNMKDEFISMASHELRTPMTAVNGLLSMILHGDYGPINKRLQHPLDNIQFSAQRQIHLINDLLDVSRLRTGKIEFTFTNFSVRQTLDEVIKTLMPIAIQKKLTLSLQNQEELVAYADAEWTKRILNNLIGNALKFTDQGGISLSYAAKNNTITISVTDTGSGINRGDFDKLFGRFQQLNGQTYGKPPGSGLGLYLSRELARKMNGDVFLKQSTINHGSTFILSIPQANNQAKNGQDAIKDAKREIAFSSKEV